MNSHAKQPIPFTGRTATRLKHLAALSAFALATASSHAEVIWVDNNDQITNSDTKWNIFASPPGSATSVVDAAGNDDGVTVSYSGFSDSGNGQNHNGAFAGTTWDPGSGDYFFIGDGTTGTITVAGLPDSEVYTVRLIGSANSDASPRVGDFQVNGAFGDGSPPNNGDDYDMHTDGFDNGEVMTWTGVAPSGGVITITMDDTSGATNGDGTAHLNAFSIEGDFVGGNPPTLDTLNDVNPATGATGVATTVDLEATFSEAIALTGSGSITLKDQSGGDDIPIALPGDVTVNENVLTITPASNLTAGHEYAVEISSDAIEDLAVPANAYAGLAASDIPNWSFETDSIAPTKTGMAPTAGATNISRFTGLSLGFDEEILAGSGNITIHLQSNGDVAQTIDVTSGAVTISGLEATIALAELDPSTAYYVQVANGAFTDLSGNSWPGIGDTTWTFATVASSALYEESFGGSGDLNGTAPDVTLASAAWSAVAGQWQSDGTIAEDSSPGADKADHSAFLPFTPETGKVYTLTATFTQPTGGTTATTNWGPFGFADTGTILGPSVASVNDGSFWRNDTAPWMLYRENGDVVSFTGPGVTGPSTDATVSGTRTFSIVLDTTGSQWTAEWFDGTTKLGTTHTFTTNPSINFVGFGREDGVDVTINDFSLTVEAGAESFADWIAGFDVGGLDGFTDDPDGDNLGNGIEGWFGTDPSVGNPGLTQVARSGAVFSFQHPEADPALSDVTGSYEWSLDLAAWNPPGTVGDTTVAISTSTDSGTTTVEAATTGSTVPPTQLFLRAVATED
jgi:hypothetical protein